MSSTFIPNMVARGSLAVAADYGRYFTAAHFLLQGRNPYNQIALVRAEQAYRSISLAHGVPTSDGFVLLPFVIWPVIVLTSMPFWSSYVVLVVIATLLFGCSLSLMACALGWKKWWLVGVLACCAWVFVWGRLVGQLDFVIPGM